MDARRRILIFAYFFPPLGGAGVQRIVKLAKYLPAEGWDPTIVTARAGDYWMTDGSLAAELGPRVRVVRTAAPTGLALLRRFSPAASGHGKPVRSSVGVIRRLRGVASWVFVPDSYLGWLPFACRAGAALLAREPFDWILTTSSPDSAHLIGLRLAAHHGVRWAADFRDPWTRRLSFRPPTAWHRRRHERLEAEVLARADLVTFTSEETRRDYALRVPARVAAKFAVLTNGYDEEDFTGLDEIAAPRAHLEIVHAGQLNPERPARPFLLGLRRFLDVRPEARGRVRARFIGPAYAQDRADIERLDLAREVVIEAPRPHREIVRAMRAAHVLLLMEHASERGALILPGKIFEYLRAGRPILGLLPRGAAWDLIDRLGAGRTYLPADVEGCASALGAWFDEFAAGGAIESRVPAQALAPFERRALARRWAGFFSSG